MMGFLCKEKSRRRFRACVEGLYDRCNSALVVMCCKLGSHSNPDFDFRITWMVEAITDLFKYPEVGKLLYPGSEPVYNSLLIPVNLCSANLGNDIS